MQALLTTTAFYGTDAAAKDTMISKIGEACRTSGFFSLVNHGIAESLQQEILSLSEELFALPLDVKETYGKGEMCTTIIYLS